jgi:hypothetical protein
MTRLDLAPDNQLETSLKGILRDIEQIKTAQAIGKDSLVPQIVQSDQPWDVEAQLNTYYEINKLVTFTADTQLNPYVGLFLEFYELDGSAYPTSDLTTFLINPVFPDDKPLYQDDRTARLQIYIQGLVSRSFRIKIFMLVSDRGSFVVTDS